MTYTLRFFAFVSLSSHVHEEFLLEFLLLNDSVGPGLVDPGSAKETGEGGRLGVERVVGVARPMSRT